MDRPRQLRSGSARRALVAGLVLVCGLGLAAWGYWRLAPNPQPPGPPPEPASPAPEEPLALGARLYRENCAACHGERGLGDGPAAKFLHPRPRNFGEGKFRFVSAVNRVPSDQDLLAVITRGLPGSAMFPFAHLGEAGRQALVLHVRRLTRAGLEERLRQEARKNDDEVDEEQLARVLDRDTKPGADVAVPADWPEPTPAALARGRESYLKLCATCHGATGRGDGSQDQRDDDGTPTRPRDFTRGIFKSGRDPRRLYVRLRLGLPGSPMPALPPETPAAEVVDITHYVLSLSDPALQARAEHRRTLLTARRVPGPLPDVIADEQWGDGSTLAVTPLWWRPYDEPELAVAALHDGTSLAVRLTWKDRTRNVSAIRPQDFEDMAAVQLFRGSPEPFLGMGAADRPVDLWLWNPGIEAGPAQFPDVDTAYPHLAVDLYPFEEAGGGPRAHAPERQSADFVTARRAGNLRADPLHGFTGSSLEARGLGSATMRPRASQLVAARGAYTGTEGDAGARWSVVFRRPLRVPEGGGLGLAPGDQLSVAFALWDGAARDRNGQKLVSIWHDLKLEP
jgi:mono/diheme cytochrome c family protein